MGRGETVGLVTVVAPTRVFAEMGETLAHALGHLGYAVRVASAPPPDGGFLVVMGVQALDPEVVKALPPSAILYNLEPLPPYPPPWLTPVVLNAYRRCRVWDYSRRQIPRWTVLNVPAQWVPVGYVPELTRIAPAQDQDIDVLFYGTPNPRRLRVLGALKAAGVRVGVGFGVWGAERDALIARAKLVLNVHYYDPMPVFEVVRVSYLLANRKAVVAECGPDMEIEPGLRDAVYLAPYERLVEVCRALLAQAQSRQALAERGFLRMAARDEATILATALRRTPWARPACP
jgi:hypothetical protein